MSGLSNIFLINYISPRCKNFMGVFSVDKLPPHVSLTLPCCFVTNLSRSDERGTHFIAIYISSRNHLLYFDSFGFLPPLWNKLLLQFLMPWVEQNLFKQVLTHPIQSLNSLFCGWYCVAFCLVMDNNLMSINKFVRTFKKNDHYQKNDLIVTNLIKKIELKIM